MTSGRESPEGAADDALARGLASSLVDALLVYAEPLASGAHAVVIGDAESSVAGRLLELGARGVHVFDPDPARAANAARTAPRGVTIRALVGDDLDVRDGAFDVAVVPDLAELNDPRGAIARLRRAVAVNGAVVAMGRARLAETGANEDVPFASDLGPAALEYAELYDVFAVQFEEVSLVGVVPFSGIVFAELGGEEDEDPTVSVDTRLASADTPSVFVVIATQQSPASRADLDPYAIVQVPEPEIQPRGATRGLEAAFAATQLKAELLAVQLEELRDRMVVADVRSIEAAARLDRTSGERDGALTRAMELEAVLAGSQQTMGTLERRLLEAEQGMLERDDRIAVLSADVDAEAPFLGGELTTASAETIDLGEIIARAESAEAARALALTELAVRHENDETTVHLDVDLVQLRNRAERAEAAFAIAQDELALRHGSGEMTVSPSPDLGPLRDRAERAEAALALNVADIAHVADAHARETASYEEQLRDRARVIAALEKELVRREQLVRELVASLEESREGITNGAVFESAAPLSLPPVSGGRAPAPPAPGPSSRVDPGAGVAEGPPEAGRLGAAAREDVPPEVGRAREEVSRLRRKLDDFASEVARREGELVARAWRITELENERVRLSDGGGPEEQKPAGDPLEAELAYARQELDALRQALTQEHAARVAAESGEELARARSELARQAALLEQMRGRPS